MPRLCLQQHLYSLLVYLEPLLLEDLWRRKPVEESESQKLCLSHRFPESSFHFLLECCMKMKLPMMLIIRFVIFGAIWGELELFRWQIKNSWQWMWYLVGFRQSPKSFLKFNLNFVINLIIFQKTKYKINYILKMIPVYDPSRKWS